VKRLRHPIRAIREPFGTAGLIIAMVALVAALGGSAVAANSALSGKQKKEVEKIAKKFAGKPGTNGAAGPQGQPGAAGAAGGAGKEGPQGKEGPEGKQGKEGRQGKQGEPWTAGGTLPANATETGLWSVGPVSSADAIAVITAPVASFAIKLESVPTAESVHYILANGKEYRFNPAKLPAEEEIEEAASTACLGTVAEPTATAGNLCIYSQAEISLQPPPSQELLVTKVGAEAEFITKPGERFARGSWAVTGG
jgi:hypothetical protein